MSRKYGKMKDLNAMNGDIPLSPVQPLNPDYEQRRALSLAALYRNGHPEDYSQISAALSPPPDITSIAPPGSCRGKTVGIIGGGLAGMAAAFELRKAGFDITVFEANPHRIGGRVFTYYFDRDRSLYGELGAMRIPVIHETVWHYIDLFGLDTRPFIQSNPNTFIYLNGIRVRNDPNGANVKMHIYPTYGLNRWEYNYSWQQLGFMGIEAPVLEAPPEARREILEVLPQYSPYTLLWDSLDIRRAMESRGLSPGAISMLSNLFPIGGRFLYNNYIDFVQEYYPANFIYMYEITGGLAKLPEAFFSSFTAGDPGRFYKNIPRGLLGNVRWKSGTTVTGIYQEAGGKVMLAYTPTTLSKDASALPGTARGESRTAACSSFDYVICAIPFSVLRVLDIRPLFSELKMQAVREVTYSPAQKTATLFSRRFWEEQGIFGGGSYTDLPINTIWYPSSGFSDSASGPDCTGRTCRDAGCMGQTVGNDGGSTGRRHTAMEGVLLSSYSFNMDAVRQGNLPEPARFSKIRQDIEKVHGLPDGSLNSTVIDSVTQFWDRDPFCRGTFCYFTPQQKKLFSWSMTQPEYGGRIFFAGEHVSAVHRWQQGALKSGMDAANGLAAAAVYSLGLLQK